MSVTTVPMLTDLQGPWVSLKINGSPIPDVYPFTTVADLKRMLWLETEGDPRWAPERVFLGVQTTAGTLRPLEFHWPASVISGVDLPDPREPANRTPSPALVDEAGNRKPVGPTMLGSLILESALSPEIFATGSIPAITAISLADIAITEPEALTQALFGGFYQLYFPWLTAPAQVLDAARDTQGLKEVYAAAVPYIEDRTGRIEVVQRVLGAGKGGAAMSMTTMVRLRWTFPLPAAKPESLEKTFYSMPASATLPFLRFFPAGGKSAPLLKLGLKPDGSPIIDDDKIFAQYLSQPAPAITSPVIMARIPMTSPHVGRGAAFTLYMFDGGESDITFEVPQRGMTYIASVAADAQRILRDVTTAIGFPAGTEPLLRDLHATYSWTHPDPRRSAPLTPAILKSRVAALTPFLDEVVVLPDEKAMAVFNWRAVSNYDSESSRMAYITQLVLRGGIVEEGSQAFAKYTAEIAEKFGITLDAAVELFERWGERRTAAVAPTAVGAGLQAVPKHSTGTSIAIAGAHPEYTVEIQGPDSLLELRRIVSVVGVLLGASDLTIKAPAPAIENVADVIQLEDGAVEEAAAAEGLPPMDEMDPAMAALMGDLGLDFGDGPEEAVEEVPPPVAAPVGTAADPPEGLPDLDAAMAAVDAECAGTPWAPGEPALKIPGDYYMAKLKKADVVLFGYSVKTGDRSKGYSKSCQRGDGRQPNIMSLAEYARVKRCYDGRVRFVDLPPRRPEDLPNLPKYTPKRAYDDEFFLVDTDTGLPMWTVYGYENKTRPGEYLYLICAELWCERDNLPLIRAEFEGTAGRGFTKPPNTCPFCAGAPIAILEAPRPGESVVVRQPKKSSGKLHSFVGPVTRTTAPHPSGYPLPCCDTTPRLLKQYLEERFYGRLEYGRDITQAKPEALEDEDDAAEPAPELELAVAPPPLAGVEEATIDYMQRMSTMQTQYIIGADKTLEAGKIALLPPALDAFFGQHSNRAIETRGIRPTFAPGATLFVRLGVDLRTRAPGLNLFAGLSPFMGFDSAEQTQRHVLSQRMVRAFESANYGTLVSEFAARSTLTDAEINGSLQAFATEFGYPLGPARPHIIRLYKAWSTYLQYLADQKTPKQLRHIEHLLAQPGVLMPRGLLLAVLEQVGSKVQVVCPSFGIPTASLFGDVPIAFLLKKDETWTPLILYNGTKEAVRFFGERTPELEVLPTQMKVSIQRWVREWRSASLGCGRPSPPPHVWTPDRDTTGLPRLSQLRGRVKGGSVTTLVRDRSNRLAGVMMSTTPPLFVPCLDDGNLADQVPRIYEADMIAPAPVDAYLKFYQELATDFPALKPIRLLANMEESTQVVGFQVAIGTMIPTGPAAGATTLPIQQVDAFPWERDALMLRSPDAPALSGAAIEESTASVEEQLDEAYQYLRITLSNWLQRDARGPTIRANLKKLLTANYPLFEKRKRLDILLEPLVREWISPERTESRRALSLLRQDCLTITEERSCEGACKWSGGRCLIHAPVRQEGTDAARIFTARLSDEILRYASARRQLLEGEVPEIRIPRGAVRVGDELFLAVKPKESAAGVLDRLGFTGQRPAQFPEEMLRFGGLDEDEEGVPVPDVEGMGAAVASAPLPASWVGLEIPTPAAGLEDARRLAFAAGTGRSIADWEDILKMRRKTMKLPGDPDRPFQWSIQDFYVIASVTSSNVLFMRSKPDGSLQIDTWIRPQTSTGVKISNPMYMIFWGPQQLLVTKGKMYRFYGSGIPAGLLDVLDMASPIPDADAVGAIEEEAGAAEAVAADAVADSDSSEEKAALEAPLPAAEAQLPAPSAAANMETMEGMPAPPAPAPTMEPAAALAPFVFNPGLFENID